ncbi:MAG: gamma-glutamyl-phosphate reductase, partial [Proteobacteria bacterium]|nr:gamma-glutamyl-phosphate reductase [Pseudomonadota bacterium]
MTLQEEMLYIGKQAREASQILARSKTNQKNNALEEISIQLDQQRNQLTSANNQDLEAGKNKGLDSALLDRLALNEARITGMIEGLQQIASLPDPIGEITNLNYQP